ncbi:ABC transporter substrate-binding protein [Paenibacillus rigui]|nr:ABC transporter substrate-binding protein [Paenibacillus rigui]
MRKSVGILCLIFVLFIVNGCGASSDKRVTGSLDHKAPAVANETKKPVQLTQVTSFFPGPDFAGIYAAKKKNIYEKAGLDVTVQPGGPEVSAVQVVASGKAQIGIAQAYDVLLARDQGTPLVAIFTTYQHSPRVLVFHKGQPIKGFGDLNGREAYIGPGQVYWDYLTKKYALDKVKMLKYTGSLANFAYSKEAVVQGFLMNEPIELKLQSMETDYLLVSDSGFDPYSNVLFTTEKYLKDNPETVQNYLKATIEGWNYYYANTEEINAYLKELNPGASLERMKLAVEPMKDLIYGGDAAGKGMGYMSKQRWEELRDQLLDLGIIKKKENIEDAFTVKHLPK